MADNNEFERLLGIVSQLNGQLNLTRGILNDLSGRPAAQGTSPLRNMVAGMEADAKRIEALRDRAASAVLKTINPGISDPTRMLRNKLNLGGPETNSPNYPQTSSIQAIDRKLAVLERQILQSRERISTGVGTPKPVTSESYLANFTKEDTLLGKLTSRYEKLLEVKQKLAAQKISNLVSQLPGVQARNKAESAEIETRLESVAPNKTIYPKAKLIAEAVLKEQAELLRVSKLQSQALLEYDAKSALLRPVLQANAPISPGLRAAADKFMLRQGAVTNIPNAIPQNNPADYGMGFPADFGKGPVGSSKFRPASGSWKEWQFNQENPLGGYNPKDKAKGNAAAEAAAKAEEELVKTLRQRIATEARYKTALELAIKQGFTLNDLNKVNKKGNGGIEQLRFQKRDATTDGINQELDVFNTPAGKSTAGLSNQFRTFGQGVVRDIGELTKWSLALAAVYGPLNKLKELTQTMIENQSKLAEATISVNSSLLDQAKIFDIAANAANAAGESVGGVIDAFTQAYRATGGTGTQQERLVTANKLLTDSLILSKLSTLDQAGAIDTLSAALRQSGDALGGSNSALQNGTILLDKWVRVTKIANVDLASLATGFAVLGDSAEAAGIDADHLNGIIATISETGISTGKETANIARALVGNFQTDAAEKALNQIGISARTATGEMRPLLDLMQEISDQRKQGLLDNPTFSKLTQTIGQGVRRGASTATFLENFGRVDQVAQESARANGDAQAALDKQLATVATSVTKLGNAFDKLAQTLGTDSGFLGIITGIINGVTGIVNGFDSLISLLGKATPAMIAFGAAAGFLKYRGIAGGLVGQVQGLGASLQSPAYKTGAQFSLPGFGLPNDPSQDKSTKASRFIGTNILGSNLSSGAAQGLAVALIPALQNLTNKDDRFGKTKAAGDAIGGIAGGILGALGGPGGALVGATIGVSIAEAFTNAVTADRKIYDYAKGPGVVSNTGPGSVEDPEARLKAAEIQVYKDIGGGSEFVGRALTSNTGTQEKLVEELNKALKDGNQKQVDAILKGSSLTGGGGISGRQSLNNVGISNELINKALESKTNADGTRSYNQLEFKPENYIFNNSRVKDKTRQEYLAAQEALNTTGKGETGTFSAFSQQQAANKIKFAPLLDQIAEVATKEISNKRISGDLKGTEYAKQTKSIAGFDEAALQLYTGFGEEFIKIDKNVNSAADAFNVFKNVIVKGAPESLNELVAINTEIGDLINKLSDPALQGEKTFNLNGKDYTRASATELLGKDKATASNLTSDINRQIVFNDLQSSIPNVQGDINKPVTSAELASVKQTAIGLQQDFYKGYLNFSDTEYQAIASSFDDWAQIVKDSGDSFFEKIDGIDPQFFQQAFQKLMEENKLKSQKTDPFGIQQVDLSSKEGQGLQQKVDYYSSYLTKNFPQYEQKPEDLGIIFNDYVTATLHGDNLAVKLALEKLVDINQKQLDGQYNIPEGATFWVPLTAAYYRNKGTDEAGGLDTSQLDASAGNLDGSAVALTQAAYALTTSARDAFNVARLTVGNSNAEAGAGVAAGSSPLTGSQVYSETMRDFLAPQAAANLSGSQIRSETTRDYLDKYSNGGTKSESAAPSFLESLKQMFTPKLGGAYPGFGGHNGIPSLPQSSLRGVAGGGQANVNPVPVSKLDLKISSSTVLNLDGRILANAMQNYLAQDLLRTDATQGSISKRYVI